MRSSMLSPADFDGESNVVNPDERPRFLSEADCHDLMQRLAHFSTGGGYTGVSLVSTWTGNIRWARNKVSSSGEVSENIISVERKIRGARASIQFNDTTDAALVAASRRAERLAAIDRERPNGDMTSRLPLEPSTNPQLFSEATYQLSADQRASAAIQLTKVAADAGMLSAGYIEVAAVGLGALDTLGRVRYFPYTQARYSVTVRDPNGTGSGWAGVDWYDWHKIDAAAITARALDKCLKSRNPVAIEPGRYTTILEPQAVCDLVSGLVISGFGRDQDEIPRGPFFKSKYNYRTGEPGWTKLGEKVADERITINADPMDPELGFPAFDSLRGSYLDPFVMPVYHPTTWIDKGVLINLAYDRFDGIVSDSTLGRDVNLGMPNSYAFRMTGGDTPIEEMITTTKRGLLVTRFDDILMLDKQSQLYRGYTRDGFWLIENGKISKPIKNMTFTESVLFALNNIEQLGPAQRAFLPHGSYGRGALGPAVVPSMKVKDFSFTALVDAV